MKIFVTGTRGIPHIPGGVEKHCQELYPLVCRSGHEVVIAVRSHYVQHERTQWQSVQLCPLFAPHDKYLEAIVHTFLAVIKARKMKADIIHIHGVGPSLMAPFAKLLGLRIVVTNHGPDYERSKWGNIAKAMLRLGEYLGCKSSDEVIAISSDIAERVKRHCSNKRKVHLIYNGTKITEKNSNTDMLKRFDIHPGKYLLAVARFVPEKGLHDLVEAFKKIKCDNQLVIVGDADHETEYNRKLKQQAGKDKRIIMTGYTRGEYLVQLYSHANLFILPSYHEGLPIVLLEAMSFNLPVILSDIPAHREIELNPERYVRCGSVTGLQQKIEQFINMGLPHEEYRQYRYKLEEKYNWLKIAAQTVSLYERLYQRSSP